MTCIIKKYWCIKSVKSISVFKEHIEYNVLSNSYKWSFLETSDELLKCCMTLNFIVIENERLMVIFSIRRNSNLEDSSCPTLLILC